MEVCDTVNEKLGKGKAEDITHADFESKNFEQFLQQTPLKQTSCLGYRGKVLSWLYKIRQNG